MALIDYTRSPGVIKNPRWGVGASNFLPTGGGLLGTPPSQPLLSTQTAAAAAKPAEATPDFSVLRNVKNPALEKAQTSLLGDYEKNKASNQTLFQQYLDEAKANNLRAKADLEKERAAYDTSKFKADIAKARADQEAALNASRDEALRFAQGNIEGKLLGSPLPTGMSTELQRFATDEFGRAILPYQERIAAGRLQDIGLLKDIDLRTAPLAAMASQRYVNNLLSPIQAQTSLLNSNIGSLGSLGELDRANTFYGLSTPYDQTRVPALPIPSPAYRVPSIPSYTPPRSTYQPPPQTASRFNTGNAQPQAQLRSNAEEAYKRDTGFYPQEDPNFNAMLYESYGGRIQYPAARGGAPATTLLNAPVASPDEMLALSSPEMNPESIASLLQYGVNQY